MFKKREILKVKCRLVMADCALDVSRRSMFKDIASLLEVDGFGNISSPTFAPIVYAVFMFGRNEI